MSKILRRVTLDVRTEIGIKLFDERAIYQPRLDNGEFKKIAEEFGITPSSLKKMLPKARLVLPVKHPPTPAGEFGNGLALSIVIGVLKRWSHQGRISPVPELEALGGGLTIVNGRPTHENPGEPVQEELPIPPAAPLLSLTDAQALWEEVFQRLKGTKVLLAGFALKAERDAIELDLTNQALNVGFLVGNDMACRSIQRSAQAIEEILESIHGSKLTLRTYIIDTVPQA